MSPYSQARLLYPVLAFPCGCTLIQACPALVGCCQSGLPGWQAEPHQLGEKAGDCELLVLVTDLNMYLIGFCRLY